MTVEGYPLRIPQPGGQVIVYTGPGRGYIEDADGNKVEGTSISQIPPRQDKREHPRYKSPHRRKLIK